MRAHQKYRTKPQVVTALGSQCIIAPLQLITMRENLHLRRGGYGLGDQSTTLALDRLKRLRAREARFGVPSSAVTLVEVNSRSVLRHGQRIVGEEYLKRIAPYAMADLALAQDIWRAIALADGQARVEALSAANLSLTSLEIEQLSEVTLSQVSAQQMSDELEELNELCGTLIVALPYLAIENSKGVSILRDRLARELSNTLTKLGIAQFDPGALIAIYGQDLALKDPTNVKRGFSDGFVRMLAAHLSTHHLADLCRQVSSLTDLSEQEPIISATGGA